MRSKITVLCFVGAALVLAQTALTNDSIVKMVKGGLGDDVVLTAIKAQPAGYATDPDGLIALKSAGVSDNVIAAMVARMAAGGGAPPSGNPASTAKAMVYVYRNSRGSGPPPNSPSAFCDEQELARMQNGRYFGVPLEAGKHSFRSTDGESVVNLDVKAGQTYYIRGEVVPIRARPRGHIEQVSAEEGASQSHLLKPIGSGMVKDPHLVVVDPWK